jgi:predicted TIM-barrel fold metal-dependent hydrolase
MILDFSFCMWSSFWGQLHTIDFAGADHLVAGSDYPHQIGSLEKMRASLGKLSVPAEDKDKIMNGNARKLLNL